jgi:aspartyl-tRNA(Asn)/glutamyl-tRNA(Gln) amidotransferase subunit B
MLRIHNNHTHGYFRYFGRSLFLRDELSRKNKRRQEFKEHELKKYQHSMDPTKLKGYVPIIGLEVHAQIISESKLFSGSSTEFNLTKPNNHVSLMDAAIPGTLPVINSACIEQAIKTGFALSGSIQMVSQFDRKHYFYPDLPHAYQITQQFKPIVRDGELSIVIDTDNGPQNKIIRIQRLQIEMDSGKSIHDQDPENSLIDLNRAGIALMEIVSHPDIRSSYEAELYLKKLQFLIRHVGTCNGNMDEGSMRCDVNVSIHKPGEPYGTRCEIKNLASIVSVAKAIDYEIKRQIELLENGEQVHQETRLFDVKNNKTILLRTKEDTPDYRFFPDPDLPPLILSTHMIQEVQKSLPELPDQIVQRLKNQYHSLSLDDANVLLHSGAVNFFERAMVVQGQRDAKIVSNWIVSELFGLLKKESLTLDESPISEYQIASVVDAITSDSISGKIAKQVIQLMLEDKRSAMEIAKERNWQQINDEEELGMLCDRIIAENQQEIKRVEGNKRVFSFFIGRVMDQTKGLANPVVVNRLLKQKIDLLKG